MNFLQFLAASSSTFFRVLTFIFLRVIPLRSAVRVLPAAFVVSSVFLWLSGPSKSTANASEKATNGEDTKESPKLSTKSDSWRTILLSIPTSSTRLRSVNFLINVLLLSALADFGFQPIVDHASSLTFTRLGAVYPDSVKIVVRYPQPNSTAGTVRVIWREASDAHSEDELWRDGPIVTLDEENDWINTVRLGGLWPSTDYEYKLALENSTVLPYPATPIRFHTFPDPRLPTGTHFRFVVSSCITPNFPYLPLQGRTIKGFDLLARYLFPSAAPEPVSAPEPFNDSLRPVNESSDHLPQESNESHAAVSAPPKPPAEFLLFLGDFIYADVPFYFGDQKEAYRRLYRRNYQSPSFKKIYEKLSVFHTYDDHEIINNYAGLANDSNPPYPNASEAYSLYNAQANFDSMDKDQYYYEFRYGDVAFFVMDTRRYRSDVKEDDMGLGTMLGDKQLSALYTWLNKVNGTTTFKFIVSSVPLTSLWGHDAVTDSWAGFAHEKAALLSALHSVPNVIILSGDRHEFAAVEFNPDSQGHVVREFSTSPMSMFYVPFEGLLRPVYPRFKMQSEDVVRRKRDVSIVKADTIDDSGEIEEIPRERALQYIPAGNYKWSALEVDTRDLRHPKLTLEVMIDGSLAYTYEILGEPVKLQSSTALSAFVPSGIKDVWDRIGINPNKWF